MNIPLLTLLGFVAWTLSTLFASLGVYRWSRILGGRASIAGRRADLPRGTDWYRRAMRAHMNYVENLPLYCAIVMMLMVTGIRSPWADWLSVTRLTARIGQTVVHIGLPPTSMSASIRFTLFATQIACMIAMGSIAATSLAR